MKSRYFLVILLACSVSHCLAQNFSGLQNKKLSKIEDIGSVLESQLGSLLGGGKPDGKIDSVTVTWDSEKTLKVKIWYTDFINAFFKVSVMTGARQKQNEIKSFGFKQASNLSPVECILDMADGVPKGTNLNSTYLRLDISKKENGSGRVNAFTLNKNWRNQLDPQNVVIDIALQPVGKAASLTNEKKDVMPAKTLYFNPNLIYTQPTKVRTTKFGTGNHAPYFTYIPLPIDISGTWINADASSNGMTKLIITTNSQVQGFGRCAPQDCDWGKVSLTTLSASGFRAVFTWSFKSTILNINSDGTQLSIVSTDNYKDSRPSLNTSYIFKKNIQQVKNTMQFYKLDQINEIKNQQPTVTTPSTKSQGPGKSVLNLLAEVSSDVDFARPQDISNINFTIFVDKNPYSGVYYMFPADYHLRWDPKTIPENGYEFNIVYGSQKTEPADGGSDAPVRMSASLTADISSKERDFVRELLIASDPTFTELRDLPLRENPQFTFQSTLTSQYNIPQDKIKVETTTNLNNDIKVSWQTDADTKEFIQTAFTTHEGIAASVILKPDNEDILDQQIPAIINLADIRTLGKMRLEPMIWRTRNWRNATPYPLKLRYLHVLKKQVSGKKPVIYSWSMNDIVVPSQAQVRFDPSKVPDWLDNDVSSVMWIDYTIEDCPACDLRILDAVTDGVAGTKSQQVKVIIPTAVFDTLQASYFLVNIRSVQVDPKGTELKELPALKVLSDDSKEYTVGPLYLPAGGVIEYEYRITVATGGDFYTSDKWIKTNEKELLLGKTKLKDMFRGIIPGIN